MIHDTYSPPHLLDSARWANMRIGLLGGSFNPPHEGHLHVSLTALHMLKLDFIWWLIAPQNPFKDEASIMPYEERFRLCREMTAGHPQILVTDIERQMGFNRSVDTLITLKNALPRTALVWVTGLDIAHEFHLWHRWRDILKIVATAHIARPPYQTLVKDCPLRALQTQNHRNMQKAEKAPLAPGHSYWLMQCPVIETSSTEIRAKS